MTIPKIRIQRKSHLGKYWTYAFDKESGQIITKKKWSHEFNKADFEAWLKARRPTKFYYHFFYCYVESPPYYFWHTLKSYSIRSKKEAMEYHGENHPEHTVLKYVRKESWFSQTEKAFISGKPKQYL